MSTGNGAYVVHRVLESHISGYQVRSYHPNWTLLPFLLPRFRDSNACLVHTTPDYAPFFRTGRSKMVITFHNYVLDRFMWPYSSAAQILHYQTDLKWFIRKALRLADVVTSVSQFTARLVKEDLDFEGVIRVIPNGVDIHSFSPQWRNAGKPTKALFCGNPTQRKGAQWLPAIADHLDSDILVLHTQGLRMKSALPCHSRLQPIGTVGHTQMPDLYRSVDILLLPTVREGMSLAVLEAMACGLPVVSTDCSSMPELIDDGKGGFLCPLGDVKAFAEKINLLAASPVLRRRMGEYNRRKVEQRFTVERMVAAYRALFEEILQSSW